MELHLGIDVGTQGTKAIVFDVEASRIVARASRSYELIGGLAPGAAEQDPETWIDAIRQIAGDLARELGSAWSSIRGVGVSGQQHGFVALDDLGRVVRPAKLWCDTQTATEARELSEKLGRAVPTGFTASKILWLARHESANWTRTKHVLLPHDFVNQRLTAELAMECGDASGTGFFDPRTRRFDERAMQAIDATLEAKLPRLIGAGEFVGRLSKDGAALLALPVGIPVASGGGDNMLSAIGSGATRPGIVVVSLGTSGTVFAYSNEPIVDAHGLIAPFCDSTGAWLPLLCVMNATGVLEEVCQAFAIDHATATREAALEPIGSRGVTCLPFLQGERVPDLPNASGSFLGLRAGSLRRATLYRAALEGVALNLAWGVERMRELGLAVERVRVVGGGAQNALWRSILADALDATVETLAESESAALGGALQSAWSVARQANRALTADDIAVKHVRTSGEAIAPDRDRVLHYRELRTKFVAAARALHGAR